MKLTPAILKNLYSAIYCMKPFDRWSMPLPEEINFVVNQDKEVMGSYLDDDGGDHDPSDQRDLGAPVTRARRGQAGVGGARQRRLLHHLARHGDRVGARDARLHRRPGRAQPRVGRTHPRPDVRLRRPVQAGSGRGADPAAGRG